MVNNFWQVFKKKPVILGMIHLAGDNPVERAIEELKIYEEEGLSGAIIEDYHSPIEYVFRTLEVIEEGNFKLKIGVSIIGTKNTLTNEYKTTLKIAEVYKLDFVKLDFVTGKYKEGEVEEKEYLALREKCPDTIIIAAVQPKYFTPLSNLEEDLVKTTKLANAIIVSENEVGVETSLERIVIFREVVKNHPLIIGGGLTVENACQQLSIADGAIVGTSLKKNKDTRNKVSRESIQSLMRVISPITKKVSC